MRRKVTKRHITRCPNGYERVVLVLPKATIERLERHCGEKGITSQQFIKRAMYKELPVKYEVDEKFVFPFGKYMGETAGEVMQIDPSYIEWAERTINGFTLTGNLKKKLPEPSTATVTTTYDLRQFLRNCETLQINRYTAWGYDRDTCRYRKIATRHDPNKSVWKPVDQG